MYFNDYQDFDVTLRIILINPNNPTTVLVDLWQLHSSVSDGNEQSDYHQVNVAQLLSRLTVSAKSIHKVGVINANM
jgi:hypothetical protein